METLQPKLRFPEFNGDLLNKKIGEVADLTTGNKDTQNKVDDGEYPFYVRSQTIERINSFSYDGEAILTSGDGVGVGKNFHYINGKFDFHQRVYCIHKFKENINGKFVFQYFSEKFLKRITRMNAKNSVDSVRREMIFDMPIFIPSLPEQTRIANFLSSVDEKLNLLKEKKTLLEDYKKGIMQKIFNQQIRFKDDNGEDFVDWEKVILSEVFDYKKGNGLSKDKLDVNGINSCVLYGELYTKYNEVIFEVKSKTNSNEGLLSEIGDLLIPSSTTTSGIDLANVTALNFDNVLLGGDITVLRSNQEVNSVFYAYYLSNHKKEEIASYAQGITIVHLYYSHIKDMIIDLPSHEEQTKIANFLSAIDEKIELVLNQIQDTQEYKKGLLQQMFV